MMSLQTGSSGHAALGDAICGFPSSSHTCQSPSSSPNKHHMSFLFIGYFLSSFLLVTSSVAILLSTHPSVHRPHTLYKKEAAGVLNSRYTVGGGAGRQPFHWRVILAIWSVQRNMKTDTSDLLPVLSPRHFPLGREKEHCHFAQL